MADDLEMEEKALIKGNSFTSDQYNQLYVSMRDRDLEGFQKHLQHALSSNADINYVYDDPHYGTLLDISCRTINYSDFVRILIQNGADPNLINKIRKQGPLHFAVESSDLKTLQYLLDCPKTDVNIIDNTGSTALHIACKKEKRDQIKLLLGHPKIRVNALNKKNQAPIQLAITNENKDVVLELLKHKDIDIDSIKKMSGETIRELIQDKLPDLVPQLPEPKVIKPEDRDKNDTISTLFSHLRQQDLKAFTKLMEDNLKLINSNDGSHTFLQYACEFGLHEFVRLLIRLGADINETCATNNKTGLMLACEKGYYRIVRDLIKNDSVSFNPINGNTILHTVIIYSARDNASYLGAANEGRNYLKSLEAILKNAPPSRLNINQGDIKGNTALHYAAKTGNQEIIFLLLDHGAYVGAKNVFGEPPLADIPPKVLEAYLDTCINPNEKLPREEGYEIIFKYNFLVPPKQSSRGKNIGETMDELESNTSKTLPISETEPLLYMSKSPELRPLLIHPVLTSFIHLKWYSIRRFFYYNLGFYALFWLLLTVYILGFYDNCEWQACKNDNSTASGNLSVQPSSNKQIIFLWGLLLILSVLLFLRELSQLLISPFRYIVTVENWLEIFLITITGIILFGQSSKSSKNQISAIGILLSWGELVLLIGRHPSLSTNIEMFKTVTQNFLKFLAWYSILILAFALSFYSLFKDSQAEDNKFMDPGWSIFKSVVMSTGEFDSGSIPFVSNPGTSHVLFVLFVFLVAIVLFNLLNGLAVSDTQAIRADAELVGYISRIKLIYYVETMALGNPIPVHGFLASVKSFCCCVPDSFLTCNTNRHLARMFSQKTNLFPDSTPDYEIHVLPNQENRVDVMQIGHWKEWHDVQTNPESITCFAKCKIFTMNKAIVKSAKEVLKKKEDELEKEQREKNETLLLDNKKQLEEYKNKLNQLETVSLESQKLLHEILVMMKKKKKKDSSSDSD